MFFTILNKIDQSVDLNNSPTLSDLLQVTKERMVVQVTQSDAWKERLPYHYQGPMSSHWHVWAASTHRHSETRAEIDLNVWRKNSS